MARGPQLITIYWRDIPAQINARSRGEKHQVLLAPRFQVAIDRAAMEAGIIVADDYVAEWRQVASSCSGDLELAATTAARELENDFPAERLAAYVANFGFTPDTNPNPDAVHSTGETS